MKNYRKLNIAEINQLTTQFCTAEDWSKINVVEGFSPDHITHTRFSGEIELGIFEKEMELPGGLKKKNGTPPRHLAQLLDREQLIDRKHSQLYSQLPDRKRLFHTKCKPHSHRRRKLFRE